MPPKRSTGFKDAPHYLGHRERLRTRFRDSGAEALADYELLELLLFRTQPRRDVKPLAKAPIEHFGSFAEAIAATPVRLAEVEGLGEAAAIEFKIVEAAAPRLARERVRDRKVLSFWSAVIDYCRASMAFAEKEQFRVFDSTHVYSGSMQKLR
jgi:DNA repair protein RadC